MAVLALNNNHSLTPLGKTKLLKGEVCVVWKG